jgi:hypothetical protein
MFRHLQRIACDIFISISTVVVTLQFVTPKLKSVQYEKQQVGQTIMSFLLFKRFLKGILPHHSTARLLKNKVIVH